MQNNFDLELKSIQLQNEKLSREVIAIRELLEKPDEKASFEKEYYTIEECALMKGGAAVSTYKSSRILLPGAGNPKYSVNICGRICFPRSVVLDWIKVDDSRLLDYIRSCGISENLIPERFKQLAKKAGCKIEEVVCN